jgi:hypothetical protein
MVVDCWLTIRWFFVQALLILCFEYVILVVIVMLIL